ncbi:MAG: hypothetical protein K8F36_14740 [Melioribacteraceae bacterium]|nr:hypothetical protein [Melioribacteraceae bacterium]
MEGNGYISLHRQILENPVSNKPNYLAVWIYLLLKANYKPKKIIWNNEKIDLKAGQFIGSILQIAGHFSLSTGTITYILDFFEKEGMLKRQSTKKFTLFEILNYEKYQKVENKRAEETLDNKGFEAGQESIVENKLKTNRKQIETTNKDNKDNKETIVQNEFERFWNLYDKKVSKEKSIKLWKKLKAEDKQEIFRTLPEYVKATPDKQYRKNPDTYLRNKSWKDEIPSYSQQQNKSNNHFVTTNLN